MNILHIANDFCYTKVHANLYKLLDEKGVIQTIYNPVRDASCVGRNKFDGSNTKIVYSHVVKSFHRYFYHIKRYTILRDLLKKVDVKKINLCHATTLFTDGGLAYQLYKRFHIPYVVAVRNTDINGFMNLLPNTWLDGIQILLHAERIFFISEGLKQKFEHHLIIRPMLRKIQDKFMLMPNGIDDYYLDNICQERRYSHKVIYVGDFSDNKNVFRLQEAVMLLRKDKGFDDLKLTLVGGGNNANNKVERMTKAYPDIFEYVGKIYDKQVLLELFRNHAIFAMPSIHETFGLVYLEALSQNLPVLFTKGQGIDGLLSETIGERVNPYSVDDIKEALKKLLTNRNDYSNRGVDFSQFCWEQIANKYIEQYKDCLGCADVNKSSLGRIKKYGGIILLQYYKLRNNKIHYTSEVGNGTHFRGCKVGKYCFIGGHGVFNNVDIGNYTCIAPSVQIGGMEHSYWYPSISPKLSHECLSKNRTIIGHDVWIAASSVIKQGISIGDGAVVGANSFVNKDVPQYAVAVGSPAKIIKYRYTEDQIKKIQESKYWEMSPREARKTLARLNENL